MSPHDPPSAIALNGTRVQLQWGSRQREVTAVHLRSHCRCTECRQQALRGGVPPVAADVEVTGASPIGAYGIQLHFSDGHERGIFPWAWLHELAA